MLIERLQLRFRNGAINEAYVDRLVGKIITAEQAVLIKGAVDGE